jgi:hypothetical protein
MSTTESRLGAVIETFFKRLEQRTGGKKSVEKYRNQAKEHIDNGDYGEAAELFIDITEKWVEKMLDEGEYSAAGTLYSVLGAFGNKMQEEGNEAILEDVETVKDDLRREADEIVRSYIEDAEKRIEEAEKLEDKVSEQMINHQASEGVKDAPISQELSRVQEDLQDSEEELSEASSVVMDFGLERDKKEIRELKEELTKAKRRLREEVEEVKG